MSNRVAALFRRVSREPNATALIFGDVRMSFAELLERVRQTAGALSALGIRQGDRVGLWLPSTPEFITAQQALFLLGAVVTPINVLYSPDDVRHAAAACDLNAIITLHGLADKLGADVPCLLIATDVAAETATYKVLPLAAPPANVIATVEDDALAMLLLTSATTGKAKGVMLTTANLAANYDRTPAWLGLNRQSVILCALPLYNTFGLNQGINAMLQTGCTMVLLPRFDAQACILAIAEFGCTFLPAVPTMLQKIVDHPLASRETLGSLRTIMTGGAPVPSALLRRLLELAPNLDLLTGYGLTEATALVTLTQVQLNSAGQIDRERTIGRVLEGMDLSISDNDGRLLALGQTGEIVIRGPNVMAGYFRAPEDTAVALADGWLRTGDIGYVDADGYAFIVDRKKDVIIRGGQNIYPADIEEVLYKFPGVSEAAVVARADDLLGEVPVAFVVLSGGGTVEQMVDHCRAKLASYKCPVAIEIRGELPKGPTGKILRRALRDAPQFA